METTISDIRFLASSKSPDVVLAAEFKDIVHVWDLNSQKCIATLAADFDFGGKRIALSNDAQTIYCAAYQRNGVSAYSLADGKLIWNRRDLKKCQVIRSLDNDTGLWCAFDDGPLQLLDRESGITIQKIRGVREIWESRYGPLSLLEHGKHIELRESDKGRSIKFPLETFALLSVVFAPGFVILSQAGGATRCLCLNTASEVWRREETGTHCLQLGYSEADQTVLSIWWNFERGGDHRFIALDIATGQEKASVTIKGATAFAFCRDGQLLVCSNGEVIDTGTGNTDFTFKR